MNDNCSDKVQEVNRQASPIIQQQQQPKEPPVALEVRVIISTGYWATSIL